MHSLLKPFGVALLVPALALPALFACQCDPEGPPAPPGACTGAPATSTATEIAVGNAQNAFAPSPPGGSLDQVRGGQGASMVAFRVAVRTTESFTCLPVRLSGDFHLDRAIPVHRDGDWLVTDTLYEVASGTFRLNATSYGLQIEGVWAIDDPWSRDAYVPGDAFAPDAPDYFDAPRRVDAGSDAGGDAGSSDDAGGDTGP